MIHRQQIAAFLLVLLPALGQAQHIQVFDQQNADGSVSVYARNSSFIPYSLTLKAGSLSLPSTPPLPVVAVLIPSKRPKLLTTFAPVPGGKAPSYSSYYQPGFQTGQIADTSYVYQLPLRGSSAAALPRCACDSARESQHRYLYVFETAASEPVRAAREGIVGIVRLESRASRTVNKNLIVVLHDDGTYANYENLRQHSATVIEGQRVAAGDILGYSKRGDTWGLFWFNVQQPGQSIPMSLPVVFGQEGRKLRPK